LAKNNYILILIVLSLVTLFLPNSVFATPAKLPLTIEGKAEISADGRSIEVICDLSCPETFRNVSVDINVNNGDSLLSSPAGLVSFGEPFVDSIDKLTRRSFNLDMANIQNFSFKIAPNTKGDHKIYVRVISLIDEKNAWSDEYSFYYHDDGSRITEGYQELSKDFRTLGEQVVPGSIQECPQPARPPVATANPDPDAAAPPNPLGTVTVTGRWMYFDEANNYSPQFERRCELLNGSGTHLAWDYTDSNGYFSFPAVTNPGSLYVAVRTETYYGRAGGTDHLWVRDDVGNIYSTNTPIQTGVPDGTYNIGQWTVPNGATHEKAYWAIKKIQDVWRYVYFIDTVNTYPGSIECQWYVGSTDGTFYRHSDNMVHLKENDPTGTYTVVHESGHSIFDLAYGGTWPTSDCPNPHYINLFSGTTCGWTEGWADFLPIPVFNDPVLSWPSGGTVDFETPTWGTSGWSNGLGVEGRVAGSLWDIMDSNNEADNDFFTDNILDIWQTVWGVNSDNFCQFWDSTANYGIKRSRDNCLYQNTINNCITCVEDAREDDDGCGLATAISVPSSFNYEHCSDEDWMYITAQQDWTYTFETDELGYSGDTILALIAKDCSTQIASNDNKNTGNWPNSSKIVWTSDRNARVNIGCKEAGNAYGAHKSYTFSVSRACTTTPSAASGMSPANNETVCISSPTLSWTGNGRNYDVVVDGVTSCSATTSTSCATSGLASGSHSWYVISRNGCGNTSTTSTYWFYVGTVPASGATTAADASGCADTGVNISWAAPSSWGDSGTGTRTYSVYRSDSVYVATGLSESTLSYNDNTGINGTTYTYRVKAINTCGFGTLYTVSSIVADNVAASPLPSTTTVADPSACSDNGVNISWTAPSSWGDSGNGTRTYSIYRSDSVYVATGLSEGTTSYNDNTGINGTTYYYWVRAMNGCSNETSYSISAGTADNVASSPYSSTTTAVDASGCADTGVNLTWAAPLSWGDSGNGTRTYSIYRSDAVYIATGLAEGATSYNDNTGTNGASYNYWVRAINGCSYGTWYSASASAADNVGTAPSAMSTTAVDSNAALDTGVDVSWPSPITWGDSGYSSGARVFYVYRDAALIGTFGAGTLSMNDNLGTNNVNYTYKVYAGNGCGQVGPYNIQVAMDAVSASPGESSSLGSPMTAMPSTLGTSIQVTYTGTSCDTGHSIYWGVNSSALTWLNWSGVSCGLGDSGSAAFDPGDPPAGSFFYFVVVGNNGTDEGSYGLDSSGGQRPNSGVIACFSSQNTASCL
jgi:hypothetical protein